jgi:hypothetical protein
MLHFAQPTAFNHLIVKKFVQKDTAKQNNLIFFLAHNIGEWRIFVNDIIQYKWE